MYAPHAYIVRSQIMEPGKGKRYGILNFMSEQDGKYVLKCAATI
jgi:hypothetical protein